MRCARLIVIFGLLGFLASGLALVHHYGYVSGSYCDLEGFSCDLVNRSVYARMGGIPVALIGLGGYGAIIILALRHLRGHDVSRLLLLASFLGFTFALYLAGVAFFVLAAWCALCLVSFVSISAIVACAARLRRVSTLNHSFP